MITYPISTNFCKRKFFCNVIGVTIFHLAPVLFYWRFRVCFISTEKWNKKGKYPDGVQIFTFSLEKRFVSRQRFQKEIWRMVFWWENVFKGNLLLQFSWIGEFRGGKLCGWRAHDELQCKNGLNDQR